MIALARSDRMTRWMHGNRATAALARRFVGGDSVDDGIAVAKRLHGTGFKTSLYYLADAPHGLWPPGAPERQIEPHLLARLA